MRSAYLLIEARRFTEAVEEYFSEDEYADFQVHVISEPDQGKVIPGASPLRKIRWRDSRRGKGARGGLRVIYFHVPDIKVLYLLDVYSKDEADDLTASEKKALKGLTETVIEELRRRHSRGDL